MNVEDAAFDRLNPRSLIVAVPGPRNGIMKEKKATIETDAPMEMCLMRSPCRQGIHQLPGNAVEY
ncbi:hypothetical protein GCM10023184_24820 [Flaviaesturariibacter amylovorans]|uniref:Uncharacterized protein n=2 Tax=Flaviaesturariibacter amylovorans TaxID=1084520 RepID=A0ABP8H0P7_9BACT